MNRHLNDLTAEYVRSILHYDPDTGLLTWKGTKSGRSNGVVAGASGEWGNCRKRRMVITINYKMYKYHRIIWLWMTGEWPKGVIDHRDRNAMNNQWNNLRDVIPKINSENRDMHRNNTSGVTGLYWDRFAKRWRVESMGGKFIGNYRTKDEAMRIVELHRKHSLPSGDIPH